MPRKITRPDLPSIALAAALIAIVAGCRPPGHVQIADPEFEAVVGRPAVVGEVRVVLDEAHDNFHTAEGRYRPFAELLRADGFTVERGLAHFSGETLARADLLVVANAAPPSSDEATPAFSDAEVAAVEAWVRGGGALLLIADHAPFGAAAGNLAAAFGVEMSDGHLRDPEHADTVLASPYVLVFEREEGLIGDHPVTRGRDAEERVDRVVTFGGQALGAPAGASPILLLADTAEVVDDPDRGRKAPGRPAAGRVQAVALEHGAGRVVVLGEAAVFTSQVIRGDAARSFGRDELRLGMSRTDTDNRQLALNTVRWLAGRL